MNHMVTQERVYATCAVNGSKDALNVNTVLHIASGRIERELQSQDTH